MISSVAKITERTRSSCNILKNIDSIRKCELVSIESTEFKQNLYCTTVWVRALICFDGFVIMSGIRFSSTIFVEISDRAGNVVLTSYINYLGTRRSSSTSIEQTPENPRGVIWHLRTWHLCGQGDGKWSRPCNYTRPHYKWNRWNRHFVYGFSLVTTFQCRKI